MRASTLRVATITTVLGVLGCAPEELAGDAALRMDAARDSAGPRDTTGIDTLRADAPRDARGSDTPGVDGFSPPPDGGLRCAPGGDTDGDGLTNEVECRDGTDPTRADTDGDGLSDGVEVRYPRACVATDRARQRRPAVRCAMDSECMAGERCAGLDPRAPDSDGDTVPDGQEDPDGNGAIDAMRGQTDPRIFDTDGDGRGDAMSGLAICRPAGLATVVQTALPGVATQVGYDPAWSAARRITGTMMRAALALDDPMANTAGLVAAISSLGDVRAESVRVEALVTAALGAGTTPVLVGRALLTHEMNPGVSSTYRVLRMSTASALRDGLVMPLVGVVAPPGTALEASGEFLVDVTTVRRTLGRSMGTTDVIVTVAPRALLEDRARVTAIRANDLSNATAVAESDRGLGFNCQRFTAPAPPPVDFVWPVDVSPSMGPYQESIGNTAQTFFTDFARAGVDFRVAVLAAQSMAFDFARPGLRFVLGTEPMGARDLAYRVTTERYMMRPDDMLAPYPNNGMFTTQLNEEPLAAGVIAFEQLIAGRSMGLPLDQRVRAGATLAAFFVADETGNNDDMRFFARDQARWGRTYPERIINAAGYFRTNRILTFGMVNDQGSLCTANDVRDMRKCLIEANGGAYIPIRTATPAEVSAAMARIVSAVIGSASPYRLDRTPITSTLKVRLRGMDVPRSRESGFDYDPGARSVVFYGTSFRPAMGDEVVISYRIWQACPAAGASCATSGECCAPTDCVLGRCVPACTRESTACTTDADCCAPNRCQMGRCMAAPPCLPTAMTCTRSADCCSGTCTAGMCAPPPCRPISGACTSPADCCSTSCFNGLCGPG